MSQSSSKTEAIKEWSVEIIGIAGFGGIQWLLTPLIDLDDFIKVNETALRAICVALIFVVWIGVIFYKRMRQKWDEDTFIHGLVDELQEDKQSQLRSRIDTLSQRFADALNSQRASRTGFTRSLLKKPWYLMIGPPGSGKTTALMNAGLRFTHGDSLTSAAIEGVSGTRHCNWFFPEDAVLIDTAGRYTTQNSDAVIDAAEWRGFLHLLRKYRPKNPINGIVLTVSIADLLDQSSQQRSELAASLRDRIREIELNLGENIPVYFLLSKADRLAGFIDFFGHLQAEERNAIWGVTSGSGITGKGAELLADFDGFLSLQIERMAEQGTVLALQERDLGRKARIIAFASQLGAIRLELKALIESVFDQKMSASNAYLRGIYITSATQNGTPIDRIMRSMSSKLSLKLSDSPLFSGTGKSFFLRDLFRELILRESHLVSEHSAELARQRSRRKIYHLGLSIVALVFSGLIVRGYMTADAQIEQMRTLLVNSEVIDRSQSHPEVSNRLLSLTDGIQLKIDVTNASAISSFGLAPRSVMIERLNQNQATLLLKDILPRLEQDLKDRLAVPASNDTAAFYHALAAYLLLQRPLPRPSDDLNRHLLAIYEPLLRSDLSDEIIEWSSSVLSHDSQVVVQENPDLIKSARDQLWNLPQGMLMASLLSEYFDAASSYNLKINEKLGPYAEISLLAKDGSPPSQWFMPGLYTETGYRKSYLPGRNAFIQQLVKERFVLGKNGPLSSQDVRRVVIDVEQTYFKAYAESWRGVLSNMTLRPLPNRTLALARIDNLTGSGDPIRLLFELVSDETDLDDSVSEDKAADPVDRVKIQLMENADPEVIVVPSDYRIQLKSLFEGYHPPENGMSASLGDIDTFLRELKVLIQNPGAQKSLEPGRFDALRKVTLSWPEPWKNWYGMLLDQSRELSLGH